MFEKILVLVFCHLIGDYVLQCDFIAKTKGENRYHMLVHCLLYCVPFYFIFGMTWQLGVILLMHGIVDPLKASFNKISYTADQVIHYLTLLVYFI